MRTYFCGCGNKIDVSKGNLKECSCGKSYGYSGSLNNIQINMRKTLSGTTKVEFNHVTMDEDIAQRNRGR